ncbi:RNA ligase RtcB family protein [Bacterioplanoides sp.]|uniref:RNA ligase RtcB family protein n=1 Tax=Bacterioplanoides sp. TaxID=2066072 RepID=UPI003B004C5A
MGISHNQTPAASSCADIKVISATENWMEGAALQQLQKTAELDGMVAVAGMPDLHPGRGYPIGAAFFSVGKLYPALVGNDIGCGMSLWQSSIKVPRLHLDKLAKRLNDVEQALDDTWSDLIAERKCDKNIQCNHFDHSLGTIGGGNHFAEFQAIDDILMPELAKQAGIDKSQLLLLVHSGSRGLGQKILTEHIQQFNHDGLIAESDNQKDYIEQHDEAVRWAELNRELIARRFLKAVKAKGQCLLDINHNTVLPAEVNGQQGWLHRKGATPADQGMVIIPGSRGDYSYLVKPIEQNIAASLFSLAHGAGRKWKRTEAKERLYQRFKQQDLLKTSLGSRVICGNKELLYEEAPQAYKSCDQVIASMTEAGLIQVVARLRPVLTFKTQGKCSG